MSESARTGTAECDCVLESYPQNRGGQNDLHDYCANYLVPPDGNEFSPNGAVFCDEKEPTFDAVNGGQSSLWEVKTNNWSKYNKYTSLWEGGKAIAQFEKQSIRARQSGKRFKILFGDIQFHQYMNEVHGLSAKYIADETIVNPECKQP